ncbi:hypothetical protein DFH06DRAFT_1349554 [Mycena polygramma]|nr:hypothetical protein DFH06DRAFT_1349554 [Mycena polygramma]
MSLLGNDPATDTIDWCPHCPAAVRTMTAKTTMPVESDMEKEYAQKLAREVQQSPFPWRLHPIHNVPFCDYKCSKCAGYLAHLCWAATGRSSDELEEPIEEGSEDEMGSNVTVWHPPAKNDSDDESGDEDEDDAGSELRSHMQNIFLLQSAYGRLKTNHLFQTDPAAFGLYQKKIAELLTQISVIQAEHEEVQAQVHAVEQQIQSADALIEELQDQILRSASTTPNKRIAIEGDLDPDVPMEVATLDRGTQSQSTVGDDIRRKLEELRREFEGIKLPAASESPQYLARWIQAHRSPLHGVPAFAPDWVVDLRDARGHQALMTLVPSGPKTGIGKRSKSARKQHRMIILAILRILLIPGAYAAIIQRISAPINNVPLSKLDFGAERLEELTDEDALARKLADNDLTFAIADDCWQFCYKFAQAELKANATGYNKIILKDLLASAQATIAQVGKPGGICPVSEDIFPLEGGI